MSAPTPSATNMPQILPSETKSACCSPKNEMESPWIKRVNIICSIAIGVFSATLAPELFAASLAVGFVAGGLYVLSTYWQKEIVLPESKGVPVCAIGYMELLSKRRFPPIMGLAVTSALLSRHIHHDPQFYVPFCGLFLGFWIGIESANTLKDLGGRMFSRAPTPKHACCQG